MKETIIGLILGTILSVILISIFPIFDNDKKDNIGEEGVIDNVVDIHPSAYDYTTIAKEITHGKTTDLEKIKAIYEWICTNIAYDTTYSIYHADECFDKRRGVCNAYSELFYYIAKSVDIKSQVLTGKSKTRKGYIDPRGHAWVCAEANGRTILLDPTWGAGSVSDDGVFTRSENIWTWFDVDPRIMVFSHYPNNEEYQFLEKPLTYKEFQTLSYIPAEMSQHNLDLDKIHQFARNSSTALPRFYGEAQNQNIILYEVPLCNSLRIGEYYNFRLNLVNPECKIAIANNGLYTYIEEFTHEGLGMYSIRYMPRKEGDVMLCYYNNERDRWVSIISYNVAPAKSRDWDKLSEVYPLSHPDIRSVENLYADEWKSAGVDNFRLAELIRRHNVSKLPILYSGYGQYLKIIDIPMTRELQTGRSYTFRFVPCNDRQWAIIEGASTWHREWDIDDDGVYSMTITLKNRGDLKIATNLEGSSFYTCIGYEIKP